MDTKRATTSGQVVKEDPDHSLPTDLDLKVHLEFLRGWMEDLNREIDLKRHHKWAEEDNDV